MKDLDIIAFIQQKGGVGKTTSAVNLAERLAFLGYKTLLADLDPQANSTLNYSDQSTWYVDNLFCDKHENGKSFGLEEVSLMAMGIDGKHIPNLHILPSRIRLSTKSEQLNTRFHSEKILFNAIKRSPLKFEFIILDCPPNLGVMSINAIYAANKFIVPVDFSRYSLEGLADLLSYIPEIKEIDDIPNNSVKILRNRYAKSCSVANNAILKALDSDNFKKYVGDTVIRECEELNKSNIRGCSIFVQAPKSNGAIDFENLTSEVLEWCKHE